VTGLAANSAARQMANMGKIADPKLFISFLLLREGCHRDNRLSYAEPRVVDSPRELEMFLKNYDFVGQDDPAHVTENLHVRAARIDPLRALRTE
jgi:hypothetical protein